jgi:hypothetical protein
MQTSTIDASRRICEASLCATVSMQSRPWLMAFLISANPPNSPTMKMPGTDVSNASLNRGISALMLGLAFTISIAPTGHASAQTP